MKIDAVLARHPWPWVIKAVRKPWSWSPRVNVVVDAKGKTITWSKATRAAILELVEEYVKAKEGKEDKQ